MLAMQDMPFGREEEIVRGAFSLEKLAKMCLGAGRRGGRYRLK